MLPHTTPDFPALTTIGNGLMIRNNGSLTSLGDFSALEAIHDAGTKTVEYQGVEYQVPAGNGLIVRDNPQLAALGDFSSLQSIDSDVDIGNNASLSTLGDFGALQSVGLLYPSIVDPALAGNGYGNGMFRIEDNYALTSFGDFSSFTNSGRNDIYIYDNSELDACLVEDFVQRMTTVAPGVYRSVGTGDNKGTCTP